MDDRERLEGLARNLRSAWRAHHLGITLSTAHKLYHAGDIEEEIWFEIAVLLDRRWQLMMAETFQQSSPDSKATSPVNEDGMG